MKTIEMLDAIDENNMAIGQITKEDAYKFKISHRVVHVMVYCENKLYIPRRSQLVRYLPGYYCSSAGGHVRAGENSLAGALRELKEEIGLDGPIQLVKEFFYEHEFKVHTSVYIKKFNLEKDKINIDSSEVDSGEFYSLDEIANLDGLKFHPQLHFCVDLMRGYL